MNLTLPINAPALELGSLIHKTLAQWTLESDKDPEFLFMMHAADRMTAVENAYQNLVGARPNTAELAPLYDSIELGRAMIANYQKRWSSPLPENMQFASMEQEIVVPIGPHNLTGTLDGLLQSKAGHFYVLERKTYSKRPSLEYLQTAEQFTAYCWMIRQLGLPIRGIAYDGLYKAAKPTRTIAFDDLFLRTIIHKTNEELDEFERTLKLEFEEMTDPQVRIYPNRQWQGCNDCAFTDVCTAQSRGEPTQPIITTRYVQRDREQDYIRGVRHDTSTSN